MKTNAFILTFFLTLLSANLFAQVFCTDKIPNIDPLESIVLAPEEILLNNSTLVMSKYDFDILVNHPDTEIEPAEEATQQLALDMVVKMNAPSAIGIEAVKADENTKSHSLIDEDLRIIVAINAVSSSSNSLEFTEYFVATMKITALPEDIDYEDGKIPVIAVVDSPLKLKLSGYETVGSNQALSFQAPCCDQPEEPTIECGNLGGGGGDPDCGGTMACPDPWVNLVSDLTSLPSYGGEYFPVEGACGPTYQTQGGRYAIGIRALGTPWINPVRRTACELCTKVSCPELGTSSGEPDLTAYPPLVCGEGGSKTITSILFALWP